MLNEQASRPTPSSPQGGASGGAVAGQSLPQPPPGMSLYAVKRVIGEAQWSPEQLEQVNVDAEVCKCKCIFLFFNKSILVELILQVTVIK